MFDLREHKNIYMIGIGGISMSGLAHILVSWGFNVSGSNNESSKVVEELIESGINVHIGHNYDNINESYDLVVYTAAISPDDPELVEAHNLGIPTVERCDFVGYLTRTYENTIGISGTHGKTTTTSMVSLCFIEAGLDPTIQVGAILKELDR